MIDTIISTSQLKLWPLYKPEIRRHVPHMMQKALILMRECIELGGAHCDALSKALQIIPSAINEHTFADFNVKFPPRWDVTLRSASLFRAKSVYLGDFGAYLQQSQRPTALSLPDLKEVGFKGTHPCYIEDFFRFFATSSLDSLTMVDIPHSRGMEKISLTDLPAIKRILFNGTSPHFIENFLPSCGSSVNTVEMIDISFPRLLHSTICFPELSGLKETIFQQTDTRVIQDFFRTSRTPSLRFVYISNIPNPLDFGGIQLPNLSALHLEHLELSRGAWPFLQDCEKLVLVAVSGFDDWDLRSMYTSRNGNSMGVGWICPNLSSLEICGPMDISITHIRNLVEGRHHVSTGASPCVVAMKRLVVRKCGDIGMEHSHWFNEHLQEFLWE